MADEPSFAEAHSPTRGDDALHDLLQAAGYAPERTRDLKNPARTLGTTAFRLFSWNAVPK